MPDCRLSRSTVYNKGLLPVGIHAFDLSHTAVSIGSVAVQKTPCSCQPRFLSACKLPGERAAALVISQDGTLETQAKLQMIVSCLRVIEKVAQCALVATFIGVHRCRCGVSGDRSR